MAIHTKPAAGWLHHQDIPWLAGYTIMLVWLSGAGRLDRQAISHDDDRTATCHGCRRVFCHASRGRPQQSAAEKVDRTMSTQSLKPVELPGAAELSSPPLAEVTASPRAVAMTVLTALSMSHLLNDLMQSLVPAVYPLLKETYHLSFTQVGLITLIGQMTASIFQPIVGLVTDRHPRPFTLAVGMVFTLAGLLTLALADRFGLILLAVGLMGTGSSVFHPEASRVARLASGGRFGFAQAFFQVGGNAGSAIGPLLAAFVVMAHGQRSLAMFAGVALLAIVILTGVGRWYQRHLCEVARHGQSAHTNPKASHGLSSKRVAFILAVLLMLILSKFLYMVSLSSYYTFYLIEVFGVSVQASQLFLFLFLGSVAAGTFAGGPLGDRIGFNAVIWVSILGVLPFTLALPYANLFWTGVLSVVIGLVLSSAFSAMVVYAQELLPNRVGMVAGLFFGFAFGIAGIGAAALGWLADHTGIVTVYHICSYLPALGMLAIFLPNLHKPHSPLAMQDR